MRVIETGEFRNIDLAALRAPSGTPEPTPRSGFDSAVCRPTAPDRGLRRNRSLPSRESFAPLHGNQMDAEAKSAPKPLICNNRGNSSDVYYYRDSNVKE